MKDQIITTVWKMGDKLVIKIPKSQKKLFEKYIGRELLVTVEDTDE